MTITEKTATRPETDGLPPGRLAELFAPTEHRPVTPRRVLSGVATVVVATVASLLRVPGPGGFNTIWAEDASIFLTDAYAKPLSETLFASFNGYFHVYGRALAAFAALLPVSWGAPVLVVGATATSAVLALVVYVASAHTLRHPLVRSIAAAGTFALPLSYGMPNQIAPLHFVMLYTVFWCLLWTPTALGGRIVQVAVLLVSAASSILIVFFLPLALLRLWMRRTWLSVALLAAVVPGLVLQLGGMVLGASDRGNISAPRFEPLWGLGSYVTWALPYGFFGDNGLRQARMVTPWVHTGLARGPLYWVAVVLAWLVVAGVLVAAFRRWTSPRWTIAAVAGAHAVLLVCIQVMIQGHLVMRYNYGPSILIVVALCALLLPRADLPRGRALLPLVAFVAFLVACSALNFHSRSDSRASTYGWDVMVARARAECADTSVPAAKVRAGWVGGWSVTIPCDRVD